MINHSQKCLKYNLDNWKSYKSFTDFDECICNK